MNRHQILTGAANSGDHSFSVGTVEGVPFTAYASGCNIVILASNFQRVQIIPGVLHGNVQVTCLDCSNDIGKIAASYGKEILIFEPTPLLNQNSSHHLDYKWLQTASLQSDCHVNVLSWNIEGTKLLSGGESIQLWHLINNPTQTTLEAPPPASGVESGFHKWDCVWRCKTANPVSYLKFSPDGQLFASAGKLDRLVKIWFWNTQVLLPCQGSQGDKQTIGDANFIYLAHPRAITGLSWRKTSKYMPRNSVVNMLVTSCKDNICRLWVQTLVPNDGLINVQQIEVLANTPHLQYQRNHKRIINRLNHMNSFQQYKKRQATQHSDEPIQEDIPSLPSTYSVHDFHNFGIFGSGIAPGLHFHLACSINAETDIPLVPSIPSELNFVIHWLNNKEMTFTQAAETILTEYSQKLFHGLDSGSKEHSQETKEADTKFYISKPSAKTKKTKDEEGQSKYSNSTGSSSASLATEVSSSTQNPEAVIAIIDKKLEALLKDWRKSPDLLFSIHPVDGSFLVWLIDWLDESNPGSFHQAQVSFSSRIPGAIPLGDAATASHHLALYSPQTGIKLRAALRSLSHSDFQHFNSSKIVEEATSSLRRSSLVDFHTSVDANASHLESHTLAQVNDSLPSPTPIVCMLSKHTNGSLNLWHLTFGETKPYTQILSIGHSSRVCGHRFRINDITCHPVLPLLLTTSHHNQPRNHPHTPGSSPMSPSSPCCPPLPSYMENGFCSELILWKVDPVGPLSKSGGITELARINSFKMAAFDNVAWIPTLLPSSTLGGVSNSPSACFVASDGENLRIYQAVIDARTLLAEVSSASRKIQKDPSLSGGSTSSDLDIQPADLHEIFNIVSLQSTARPGCIIELDALSHAHHDWQNTQLLHVFQEQLITGAKSSHAIPVVPEDEGVELVAPHLQAVVDLRTASVFEEPFFLIVLEKQESGQSILHMWRIVIASQCIAEEAIPPVSAELQESEASNPPSRSNSITQETLTLPPISTRPKPLKIHTTKVCTQILSLPPDVEIVHATPTAGHLSSSNIYPACYAPYLIATACTDGAARFWYCDVAKTNGDITYTWNEWEMLLNRKPSSIAVPGQPLYVSSAYSGRMACAYKHGHSFIRPSSSDPNSRFINISIAIFECESTGGSEWVLEDTIHLKNIPLPKPQPELTLDWDILMDTSLKNRKAADSLIEQLTSNNEFANENASNIERMLSVPSYSTLSSLRKAIAEKGNQCLLTQKSLVQLDWVSTEDGSHVLTVTVDSKVLIFTPVSTDIAQANVQAMKASKSSNRPLLKQASSLAAPMLQGDDIRWMKIRTTHLSTADGLAPLPMQISWVRDGILVVGMDNEMQIFSQWRIPEEKEIKEHEKEAVGDARSLTEKELISRAQESSQLRIPGSISRTTSTSLLSPASSATELHKKSKDPNGPTSNSKERRNDSLTGIGSLPDFGLFEACRFACPVLPQYHPKQLNELLGFGKLRRVKAILSHLVRCLTGAENIKVPDENKESESDGSSRSWSRSRALSLAANSSPIQQSSPMENPGSTSLFPEEILLDYVEITSIPPLPLFTLLAADKETSQTTQPSPMEADESKQNQDYSGLFDISVNSVEDNLDDLLDSKQSSTERRRHTSSGAKEKSPLTHFGPKQALLLTKLLTHSHLPGLSSLDQMHLLALADTVASFSTAISDRLDSEKPAFTKETSVSNSGGLAIQITTDSLDDCGLRFLLSMRHYTYLLRCLPFVQRTQLQHQGLGSHSLVWAFHSETQEELIQMLPCVQRGNPRWPELRELGVGWWVCSNTTLRRLMEKVAKAAFQAKNDPMDAALFYLAMKKKNLLWGLFRSISDTKMTAFFQNNFTIEKWKTSALKNAYALLGKQRFEHAAAFFLLVGAVRDAVEICINKLDDLQLALVIARCYESDIDSTTCTPNFSRLLNEEILGRDADGNNYHPSMCHPDPFLRSMAYWMMKDTEQALTTLLESDLGQSHPKTIDDEGKNQNKDINANPSVFNFYLYLRNHPLVMRRHMVQSLQREKSIKQTPAPPLVSVNKLTPVDVRVKVQTIFQDTISPLERRLFFKTAHYHFRAGCPALALEVLSRLPSHVSPEASISPTSDDDGIIKPLPTITVGLDSNSAMPSTASEFGSSDLNLGSSSQPQKKQTSSDFDWGAPVSSMKEPELELSWHSSSDEDEAEGLQMKEPIEGKEEPNAEETTEEKGKIDIMAQQLKFIACLKIMMEELSTLATGFEVDGSQLRCQFYIWLERSVFALRELCNYSLGAATQADDEAMGDTFEDISTSFEEKMNFEAKMQRASRRKHWLKANEALLRTLLSYCSLHGAHGGGLASVRMELILLVQELHQDIMSRHLLTPLPLPYTLPLLGASVAFQKTVVADPIRHLQALTHDILLSLLDLYSVPTASTSDYSQVVVLRDLSTSLSACILQSLSDGDNCRISQGGSRGLDLATSISSNVVYQNSHLLVGHARRSTRSSMGKEQLIPTTPPNKWPGVQALNALLARDKDEDYPKLHTLLCEAFIAVYLSQLVHALATCDCHVLYRLLGQKFTVQTWGMLFGGGAKKRAPSCASNPQTPKQILPPSGLAEKEEESSLLNSLSKQRMKIHFKLLDKLGQSTTQPPTKEEKPVMLEQFVPPETSMMSCFMAKPQLSEEYKEIDYDSGESVHSEEELDGGESRMEDDVFGEEGVESLASRKAREQDSHHIEQMDPSSFSWGLLRLAIVELASHLVNSFLIISGIDDHSPLIYAIQKTMKLWSAQLKAKMDAFGKPPLNYIPGCYLDPVKTGPAIHKYRPLLDPQNTPFKDCHATKPVRRLWNFLVRQEPVQDIFIRYIFKRPLPHLPHPEDIPVASEGDEIPDNVCIVHKDQENIASFCFNKINPNIISLSTPKELQELDISTLLKPLPWLEDEAEYDIINLHTAPDEIPKTDFLVVHHPADKIAQGIGSSITTPTGSTPSLSQSSRGATFIKRHKVDGIRRMCAHPLLPLYLTGSQDGSLKLWEWGHQQYVAAPSTNGNYSKITRVLFSEHGNKFGVTDGDGTLRLWQVALSSPISKPFFSTECHSKHASDFAFVGSSSVIATVGHSSNNQNVCLWDTLMPSHNQKISAFTCHEQGSSAILYAPGNQTLITAGKKGDVCIFDIRQRQLRSKVSAHDNPIKCLALDPSEEYFVTGSADGDIKVWAMRTHQQLYRFTGEHTKSSLFRNINNGIAQMAVDSEGRLFSCGADGSLKFRQLYFRDSLFTGGQAY